MKVEEAKEVWYKDTSLDQVRCEDTRYIDNTIAFSILLPFLWKGEANELEGFLVVNDHLLSYIDACNARKTVSA